MTKTRYWSEATEWSRLRNCKSGTTGVNHNDSTFRTRYEGTHGQTDDQSDRNVLEKASETVVGGTPESEESASDDDLELNPERCGVCTGHTSVPCGISEEMQDALKRTSFLQRRVRLFRHRQSFLVELLDGFLDAHKLLGLEPNVGPVLVADAATGTGTDSLKLWLADRNESVSSLPQEIQRKNLPYTRRGSRYPGK